MSVIKMKKSPKNVIHFKEILHKIPAFLPKLPHVLNGLKNVYLYQDNIIESLGSIFEITAQKFPHFNVINFENKTYTYQNINEQANQIANFLLAEGLQKGDVLALVMENRPEFLIITLATAKIGVTCALINPNYKENVLIHCIESVQPKAVIISEHYHTKFEKLQHQTCIEHYYWMANLTDSQDENAPSHYSNLSYRCANYPKFNPATTHYIHINDGLFYIFTAGTTGLPKAALYTHRRWLVAYNIYGHILNLTKKQILYVPLPLHVATSIVVCWSSVLSGNATFAFRSHFQPAKFWQQVNQLDAAAIGYSGDICRQLLDLPITPNDKNHHAKKMIGYGLRTYYWRDFKQRFNITDVLELYASSESNISFNNLLNFDNTVGFSPLPFAVVKYDLETKKIIRDKNGYCTDVKKGDVGLLLTKITKYTPFTHYSQDNETNEKNLHHVFNEHDAYLNTGDLVRRLGYRHIQFIDRLSDTFHWKNNIISTYEIEDLMCNAENIEESTVYGVTLPYHVGRACMANVILTKKSHIFDCKEIYDDLKKVLPNYAMPIFLRVQITLEKTSAFKYSKKTLQQQNYNPQLCDDKLLVCLPHQEAYQTLTQEIYTEIQANKYTF